MNLSIEVTSEEYERIQNAERLGLDFNGLVRSLASALPNTNGNGHRNGSVTTAPVPDSETAWDKHVRERHEAFLQATPEEIAEAERELQDLMDSLNAERDRAGARRVF